MYNLDMMKEYWFHDRYMGKVSFLKNLFVFIFYLLLSVLFFGYPVLSHISTYYIGGGVDPTQYIWSFEWVKYCLFHFKNPFYTDFMWAPHGFDLTGSTAVFGSAFLSLPLTILFGPVASYNIVMILLPALAAFSMFILLKHIVTTTRFFPAILGGYIFGFSSYMINQMSSHMHLVLVFLVPLMVYLFLLKIENRITNLKFISLFTVMLVFQFLFSLEIFATFTFFGFIALIIFHLIYNKKKPNNNNNINDIINNTNNANNANKSKDNYDDDDKNKDLKLRMAKTLKSTVLSYIIAGILLSPYLYLFFIQGRFNVVHFAPADFSSNLLNFFVPSKYTMLGGKFFTFLSDKFDARDYVFDQDAYLGLPFIGILIFYFYKNVFKPFVKALMYSFLTIVVFSIGPTLHIYKYSIMPMPYKPFIVVPLIKHALPARFMLYAFFVLGIIVALFLNEPFKNSLKNKKLNAKLNAIKYASVLLGILFILPPLSFSGRYTNPNLPVFFVNNTYNNYKKFIKKGSNVLIIPFGYNGLSLYYQAIDGMYYKTAGGYLGATPSYFSKYAIIHTFYHAEPIPYSKMELANFLYKHNVKDVILVPPVNRYYFRLFGKIKINKNLYKSGVYVYPVSLSAISKYKTLNVKITKPILKAYYFSLLLKGAVKLVKENIQNLNIKNIKLSPEFLEKHGYIPNFFGISKNINESGFAKYYTAQDSWIGPFPLNGKYDKITDGITNLNSGLAAGGNIGSDVKSHIDADIGIGIGIGGSYKNLRLIFKKYARYAKKIYFPYPSKYDGSKTGNGLLLMVFSVKNLESIAFKK